MSSPTFFKSARIPTAATLLSTGFIASLIFCPPAFVAIGASLSTALFAMGLVMMILGALLWHLDIPMSSHNMLK